MKIFLLHDPNRRSPYFEALTKEFEKNNVSIEICSDFPEKTVPNERSIIHFHRLGRIQKWNCCLNKIEEYKKLGYQMAWTIHNFFPLELKKQEDINAFGLFIKQFAKKMDYIFTHTEIMKKNAMRFLGMNNITNVGFGVDFSMESDEKISIRIPDNHKFTFLQIGNMRDYKGIDVLIDSFNKLLSDGYSCRLVLAGPQYKNYINEKFGTRLNSAIIYFDKYIYKKDYKYLLSKSDVMVFPYCVHMDKFKYGFYSASIPEAAYNKKYLLIPKDKNLQEILGTLDYSMTYNPEEENGLYSAMKKVMCLSKKEIKNSEMSLYQLVCDRTWQNHINNVLTCLKNY